MDHETAIPEGISVLVAASHPRSAEQAAPAVADREYPGRRWGRILYVEEIEPPFAGEGLYEVVVEDLGVPKMHATVHPDGSVTWQEELPVPADKQLYPEWCNGGEGKGDHSFLSYPADGECRCGTYKHHVHGQCGYVIQVG